MIKVAIVEDEKQSSDLLEDHFNRYGQEKNEKFMVEVFKNAVSFLEGYQADYDIVLMDIEMPHINGMDAAKELRKIDPTVVLIFVTNMGQFAIKGYEVDAMSFILKPIHYASFALNIQKAIAQSSRSKGRKILLRTQSGIRSEYTSHLKYVEISNHKMIYHTLNGDFRGTGTLKKLEEDLQEDYFVRCNSCYLVNLQYVSQVKGLEVTVDNDVLQMSHPKKKAFLEALSLYVRGEI